MQSIIKPWTPYGEDDDSNLTIVVLVGQQWVEEGFHTPNGCQIMAQFRNGFRGLLSDPRVLLMQGSGGLDLLKFALDMQVSLLC